MTRSSTEMDAIQPASENPAGLPFDCGGFDRPLISMEEFAANGAGVFESDAELDEFLAMTYEARHRNVA